MAIERQYTRAIQNIMDIFARIAMPTIRENLPRWQSEIHGDSIIVSELIKQYDELNPIIGKDNMTLEEKINYTKAVHCREDNIKIFKSNTRIDSFLSELVSMQNALRAAQNELWEGGEQSSGFLASIISFSDQTQQFNKKEWNKVAKTAIGTAFDIDEPGMQELLDAWANENLTLIQGLTEEYVKEISGIVSRGVQNGTPTNEIMRQLRKKNKNLTRSRAKLIARDQVATLNSRITQKRQVEAGIDMYIWITAGDERVRPGHKLMSNKLCRWDDSTVYSTDGGKTWISRPSGAPLVHPGIEINCRCSAVPHFEELKSEVDNEIIQEAA
jgi:SPP1 gp7 family putative phage head morphogenesis protein